MNQIHRLPIPPSLDRSPELASLAILDVAITVTVSALLSSYPELFHGTFDDAPCGASVLRANALITQARRLAASIAAFSEAVDRETLRENRARRQRPF